MNLSAQNRSFLVLGLQPPRRPVLLSVPHAGRAYGADLIARARVPLSVLRRLEDVRADLLIAGAVAAGFTAMVAQAPRALIDLNRAEDDCDPLAISDAMPGLRPSARARGGLGLIPHRLSPEGDLWSSRPDGQEVMRRIETVHRPWHMAIEQLLTSLSRQCGAAVLLDIHSMPPPADGVEAALGDRFGLTARSELVDSLLAIAEGHGVDVRRNHPYAGAFGIERHASVPRQVQAVQVEISRALYLDASGAPDPAGVARMTALVTALAEQAAAICTPANLPLAAE